MNTNELRLGNKVLYRGEIDTVTEIGIGNGYCRNNGYFNDDKGYVEPIPLSPEILQACGFEKIREGTYKNDIFMWFNNHMYLKIGFDDEYEIGIQYLHELQNYFPITGTELTINLEKAKV